MAIFRYMLLAAVAALSTISLASAIPGNAVYFKTHPGLPSLESLGITAEQLYAMALDETLTPINGRSSAYSDHCDGNLCAPAGPTNAAMCALFFQAVGDRAVTVNSTFQVMCDSHFKADEPPALAIGYAIMSDFRENEARATSVGRDIAQAVIRTIQNCGPSSCNDAGDCGISGTAAAYGNGEFLVFVANEVMVEGDCPR